MNRQQIIRKLIEENITMAKKVITFRADAETSHQLSELAARWQTNESAAIVRCIEQVYQQVRDDDKPIRQRKRREQGGEAA